jgi:hypothetical protein
MKAQNTIAWRLTALGLIVLAQQTLAGCTPYCTTSDGSTILCICIVGADCHIDTSSDDEPEPQGDPEPALTCSGETATDDAQTWSLATIDLANCPSSFVSRYANSLEEAVECASAGASVSTAVEASEVCEYAFTHNCGHAAGTCGGDSGIMGRNAAEAERCYRRYYGGCTVRDVTDYARPGGGCRGFTVGISAWPCP